MSSVQQRFDVDYGGERVGFGGVEVSQMAGVALGYGSHVDLPVWGSSTCREEIDLIVLRSTEDAIRRSVDDAPGCLHPYPPDSGLREEYQVDREVTGCQMTLEEASR